MNRSQAEGPKHLWVGDPHAKPDQDLRRFDWLGSIIMDERPDKVVIIGDLFDMPSLCSYDKGKKKFEGRRYKNDIAAGNEALDRMMAPLHQFNERMRRTNHHERQYKPEIHYLLGNHEHRIDRACEDSAELDGLLSTDHIEAPKHGIKVYPFLDEVELDGVSFSHYFVSGVMARPIGGEHPATTLLNKHHRSCTAGHSHLADFSQRRQVGGRHIMGCLLGCYFEHDEDYVPPAVSSMWWRGLVIAENVVDGCYDPHFLSLNTIKKRFL